MSRAKVDEIPIKELERFNSVKDSYELLEIDNEV